MSEAKIREILEKMYSYNTERLDDEDKKNIIDLALSQILALTNLRPTTDEYIECGHCGGNILNPHFSKPVIVYPEKKACSSPKYTPEERVSMDMAIDAGDRELEGSLYRQESYEECGGCPECIFNQAIDDMRKLNGGGDVK